MCGNDQIWRVAISFVNSTNVVKLPNPRNSIHNAPRPESLSPETKKVARSTKAGRMGSFHGRVAMKYQISSLAIRHIACYMPSSSILVSTEVSSSCLWSSLITCSMSCREHLSIRIMSLDHRYLPFKFSPVRSFLLVSS